MDKDVERLLKQAMHRSRRSFKETLNHAVRAALGREPTPAGRPAFILTARPLGLRPGIDPTSFNKLADELEADVFRERQTRPAGHDRS
ncbi:MAG TPA: hypothetical protein VNJ04_09310 [Gemmatimonadaceae bacterium]|nr:hypothetical protein [Gemmatimonadaceae bacterium]